METPRVRDSRSKVSARGIVPLSMALREPWFIFAALARGGLADAAILPEHPHRVLAVQQPGNNFVGPSLLALGQGGASHGD